MLRLNLGLVALAQDAIKIPNWHQKLISEQVCMKDYDLKADI